MLIAYKHFLVNIVIVCLGMGLDDKTVVIEQAILWTIDDCMNELTKQLEDYVQTEEFSNRWENVK